MTRYQVFTTVVLCLTAACTGQRQAPEPIPASGIPQPVEPVGSPAVVNTKWILPPSTENHTYQSTTKTVIQSAESPDRSDTTEASAVITLRIGRDRIPSPITGEITDVQGKSPIWLRSLLPIAFSGTLTASQLTFKDSDMNAGKQTCTRLASSLLGEIRSMISTYPLQLSSSSIWTDSSSTDSCTGNGIPITVESIRTYTVEGNRTVNGVETVLLLRREMLQIHGDGAEGQHQFHLQGTGTGTSRIYLDSRTGITNTAEINQAISIQVSASGKLQTFTQKIEQGVMLIR